MVSKIVDLFYLPGPEQEDIISVRRHSLTSVFNTDSLILYLDTGTSKLIADGKIKLKTDSVIKSFTESSIVFENDTELAADVVIFATG